jgi:hypothetical protein
MAKKYKVIQWATGVVGSAALGGILRHPKLELVGLTPCPYWFPFIQNRKAAEAIEASCRKGGVNFHASGCNPRGIAERFPLTSGWCNRIDRITMTECGDCRTYSSKGVMRNLMNLGKTPEEASTNPIKNALARSWNEPIGMIAEGLGSEASATKPTTISFSQTNPLKPPWGSLKREPSLSTTTAISESPGRARKSSRNNSGTWTTSCAKRPRLVSRPIWICR